MASVRSKSEERGGEVTEGVLGFLEKLREEGKRRRARPGVILTGSGFAQEVARHVGQRREAAKMSRDRIEWLSGAIKRTEDQLARVVAKRDGMVEAKEGEEKALKVLEEQLREAEMLVGDPEEGLAMVLAEQCSCRRGCTCVKEVVVKVDDGCGKLKTVRLLPAHLSRVDMEEEGDESMGDWAEEVERQEEQEESVTTSHRVSVTTTEEVVTETVRTVSGLQEERGGGDLELQLREAEEGHRLAMVEDFAKLQRFASASLWSDVEAIAARIAVAWRGLVARGGEGTVDRKFYRIRFVSRLLLGKALVAMEKWPAMETLVGSKQNPTAGIPSVGDGLTPHQVASWFALRARWRVEMGRLDSCSHDCNYVEKVGRSLQSQGEKEDLLKEVEEIRARMLDKRARFRVRGGVAVRGGMARSR